MNDTQGSFTLPPSPDEAEDAREREAEREGLERERVEARRQRAQLAGRAQQRIPLTFRRPVPDLLAKCHGKLRAHTAQGRTLAALFVGPSGCGKSSAAAVLVLRALAEFVHSEGRLFASVVELAWCKAHELSAAEKRHPLGAGEPELVTRARTCGLLVLDDIRADSDPVLLFHVLSHRYDACLPTIATSELGSKNLTALLRASGVRRLTEQHVPDCPVLVVDCHPPAKSESTKTDPAKPRPRGR